MKRRGAPFAALLLALLLAASPSGRAREAAGPVRVLLTGLALTNRLDIALDGSYSITGGAAFQRGSRVTVTAEGGRLRLYYEGLVAEFSSLVFFRHAVAPGLENGLRFFGGYPLYAGDLHLKVEGGTLRAVLHIPVEEYLLGVVPYEMSETFPLEALKAQAVAARSYALRKAGRSGDYDVTDNANDQVYRGSVRENVTTARAVAETEGICGTWQGRLAQAFYTASNGGQTALAEQVWGAGDFGYMAMTDDPYDLENPQSEVRAFVLYKKAEANSGAEALWQALREEAERLMGERGFDPEANRFRIEAVEGVTPTAPRPAEPSRLFTRLRFALRLGRRHRIDLRPDTEVSLFVPATPAPSRTPSREPLWSDWQPMDEALAVELPVFPLLEQAMNLSINRDDNELISVREEEDRFVIEARRYGHGVGMSQRGAQQMAAAHGFTFEEILRFYYPGMKLERRPAASSLLPELSLAYLATPGPPATATPRPTLMPATQPLGEGEYRVRVSLIAQDSSLNLRDRPDTAGTVLMRLLYGQQLIVSADAGGGWLKVRTDTAEGYVMAQYVQREEAGETPAPPGQKPL